MIDIFVTTNHQLDDVPKLLKGFDCNRVLVRDGGPSRIWRRSPDGWKSEQPAMILLEDLSPALIEFEAFRYDRAAVACMPVPGVVALRLATGEAAAWLAGIGRRRYAVEDAIGCSVEAMLDGKPIPCAAAFFPTSVFKDLLDPSGALGAEILAWVDSAIAAGADQVGAVIARSPAPASETAPVTTRQSAGAAGLIADLLELEHLTDDLRVHAAHFAEIIERIAPAVAAEPEIGSLISACTRAIVWCERNREELMAAGARSEECTAGSTGPGDLTLLAETMALSTGIGWRDVDGLTIAYRAGRPVAAIYQGDGGWCWCDLTSPFDYGGCLLAGPWPNKETAQMKACGRFFAICDATPDETRAAIAACPIELPSLVRGELERPLAKGA